MDPFFGVLVLTGTDGPILQCAGTDGPILW